jgi:ADP-ribose pyrophosphatase YjhB (NUDIX family)
VTRVDYLDDPSAPEANSIAVAVSAFIRDGDGGILMIRRTDNDLYAIPGGQVEPGETLTEAASREVKEETGIDIEIVRLVGIFSNPSHVIAYDDGEVRQEFSICFEGTPTGGTLRTSDESREVRWIAPSELGALNIHASIQLRIGRALARTKETYYT